MKARVVRGVAVGAMAALLVAATGCGGHGTSGGAGTDGGVSSDGASASRTDGGDGGASQGQGAGGSPGDDGGGGFPGDGGAAGDDGGVEAQDDAGGDGSGADSDGGANCPATRPAYGTSCAAGDGPCDYDSTWICTCGVAGKLVWACNPVIAGP